jgi:C1A family cysteine protease
MVSFFSRIGSTLLRFVFLNFLFSKLSYSLLLSPALPSFEDWSWSLGQTYSSAAEKIYRKGIFELNMKYAEEQNNMNHSYTLGATPFASLTAEEFKSLLGNKVRSKKVSPKLRASHSNKKSVDSLPGSIDWVLKGAVTPVKNQGQCGACWAFSTTGAVEGITFITHGILPSLSEQELIDCTSDNQGCNGGFLEAGFDWIVKNGGISNESSYPSNGGSCKAKGLPIAAKITSYTDITSNNELALETALAKQPVSVLVEADQSVFQMYTGGVLDSDCGHNVNLAVLAVGYGIDAGRSFYKLKLSWGSDFGEKGFMRIGRGAKFNPYGECGVQVSPVIPNA